MSEKSANDEFQNVLAAAKAAEKDVEKVLREPNFLAAFNRQIPDLVAFLLSHSRSVLDIAFGVKPCAEPASRKLCKRMLTVMSPVFSQKMVQTKGLSSGLRDFAARIKGETEENVNVFCLTLQFFSKITNGSILPCLQNGREFFVSLLELQGMPCVNDLLTYLTSDGHPQFSTFLDKNGIAELLWTRYHESQDLLNLMFLSHVVSSLDPSSKSMMYISERSRVDEIMEMALQTENWKLSDLGVTIIYEMCSHCDEDDDSEESLFVRVFQYVVERIDDFAEFVGSDTLYTAGKAKAIEMITGIVSATEEVTEKMAEMVGSLFQQMIKKPQFSILHCAFLKVFTLMCEAGADIEELDQAFGLRATIVEEFAHRDNQKLFYGHLFTVADLIHDHEDLQETSEEWQAFISSSYKEMKDIIENPYGGPKPSKVTGTIHASDDETFVEKKP